MSIGIALLALPALAAAPEGRTVTLSEALAATRSNNVTLKSLQEYLVQADEAKSIGVGMYLPKLKAEGRWVHIGERHVPDFSSLEQMGALVGDLLAAMLEEHPAQAQRLAPYLSLPGNDGSVEDTFESFIPPKNTLAATFSLVVPVLHADWIATGRGFWVQYDAAVARIGHAREQVLYSVAKLYFGLCTLESMVEVTDQAIATAAEHLRSAKIRAELRTATELEVKRAELEVRKNEGQKIELLAELERAKGTFRHLTGIEGELRVVEPDIPGFDATRTTADWQQLALDRRKDLLSAKMTTLATEHEVSKQWAGYLPTIDVIGSVTADTNEAQRFDDDPFHWMVIGNLSLTIFDGGIREAQIDIARSKLRQARLAEEDLALKIRNDVKAARKVLDEAISAHRLAESQLQVARAAQGLAKTAEAEGVATYLEVIDTNTMVAGAEAQLLASRLREATAVLDLLSACGASLPWAKAAEPQQ